MTVGPRSAIILEIASQILTVLSNFFQINSQEIRCWTNASAAPIHVMWKLSQPSGPPAADGRNTISMASAAWRLDPVLLGLKAWLCKLPKWKSNPGQILAYCCRRGWESLRIMINHFKIGTTSKQIGSFSEFSYVLWRGRRKSWSFFWHTSIACKLSESFLR